MFAGRGDSMNGEDKNIDLTDGINERELGKIVLVCAFVLTLVLAFYKALVDGDFPNNVTDFLTMMAFAIGLREGITVFGKKGRM